MDPSYDNSFGSFGVNGGQNQPVVSPAGGDIVLTSTPKKNKKPIIIAGVCLIVLAIVLAIVAAIFFVKWPVSDSDYKTKFNIFANLAVSGKDEVRSSVDFDSYDEYYIENNYSDERLLGRWNEFLGAVEKSGVEDLFESSLESVQERLEFLKVVDSGIFMDESMLSGYYQVNGKEATIKYIEEFYSEPAPAEENNYLIATAREADKEDMLERVELLSIGRNMEIGDTVVSNYQYNALNLVIRDLERIATIIEGGK